MNIKKLTIGFSVGLMALMAALTAHPTLADTLPTIDFESPAYTTGNINGQQGWMKTGGYDVEVEAVSGYPNASGFGFENQALRLSNAVTSGSFGDQTFSPGLTTPADESTATKYFEASFDIGSTQSTQQAGLFLSVSPDDGNGSRMSYVGFDDQADGIHVIFYDVTNPGPLPTVSSFDSTDVATIDRTNKHSIKFEIELVPGPSNDIVRLYVDGSLEITGTSWEDYYRYDPEQTGNGNVVPGISKLLFRAGGTAAPATSGNGYLVDHVSLLSDVESQPNTGVITAPATDGLTLSGVYNFMATYTDNDPDVDAVQWAIRQGTCNAGVGTVLGNVDGHTDVANWDGQSFSFATNVDLLTPGNYCFVFNPTDDAGENDVRETREFVIANPFAVPAECSGITGLGAPIVGTNGSNVINGTSGNDLIFALGGSDKVDGKGGDDCIVGGDGSDKLIGGNGNDVILGEAGSDSIEGNNHSDTLYGGNGSDSLNGGNQDDTIHGGDDSDSLRGENGADTLNGDNGSDSLRGGNGNDTLTGGAGVDSARGESGNNDVCDAEAENTCEA